MNKAIFFFSILIFTNIGVVIAQNNSEKYVKWTTHYPSNIDLPFSKSELNKLQEVYDRSNQDKNDGNGVLVSGFNCTPPNCDHKILSRLQKE